MTRPLDPWEYGVQGCTLAHVSQVVGVCLHGTLALCRRRGWLAFARALADPGH